MITAIKIKTYEELDELIPMIEKFYYLTKLDKHYSLSAVIGHTAGNLFNIGHGIWRIVEDEDDKIIGYIVAEIGLNQLEFDCIITHAYSEKQDEEASHRIYSQIEEWARSMNCKTMSCYSTREQAMERKYGFEPVKTLMIKK